MFPFFNDATWSQSYSTMSVHLPLAELAAGRWTIFAGKEKKKKKTAQGFCSQQASNTEGDKSPTLSSNSVSSRSDPTNGLFCLCYDTRQDMTRARASSVSLVTRDTSPGWDRLAEKEQKWREERHSEKGFLIERRCAVSPSGHVLPNMHTYMKNAGKKQPQV